MLFDDKPFQPSQKFVGEAKSLPKRTAPESSFAKIRLGWDGLLETNTLAYFENSQIMDIKSFIILRLGVL